MFENKNKMKVLKQSASLLIGGLLVSTLCWPFFVGQTASATTAADSQPLVRLTNISRSQAGLPTLTAAPLLVRAASLKATDMLERGYFSHVDPEGGEPWDWLDTVGYSYQFAGENLAIDFTNPESTFAAWMASPSHRRNILHPSFQEVGIATVHGTFEGRATTVSVMMLGSRETFEASATTLASLSSFPDRTESFLATSGGGRTGSAQALAAVAAEQFTSYRVGALFAAGALYVAGVGELFLFALNRRAFRRLNTHLSAALALIAVLFLLLPAS